MKVLYKVSLVAIVILCLSANIICKIILPHKLRYLENMLNSEVVAKAAKIRQHIEANPNMQDSDKNWPLLLAKYSQDEKKNVPSYSYNNLYGRRQQHY